MVDGYISPDEERKRQRALEAERKAASEAAGRAYASRLQDLVTRAHGSLTETRQPDRMIEVRHYRLKRRGVRVRHEKPIPGWLVAVDDLVGADALAIGVDGCLYVGKNGAERKAVVCQGRLDLSTITFPEKGLSSASPAFNGASIEHALGRLLGVERHAQE